MNQLGGRVANGWIAAPALGRLAQWSLGYHIAEQLISMSFVRPSTGS